MKHQYIAVGSGSLVVDNPSRTGWLLMIKNGKIYESPPWDHAWYYVCTESEWQSVQQYRDQLRLFEGEY